MIEFIYYRDTKVIMPLRYYTPEGEVIEVNFDTGYIDFTVLKKYEGEMIKMVYVSNMKEGVETNNGDSEVHIGTLNFVDEENCTMDISWD